MKAFVRGLLREFKDRLVALLIFAGGVLYLLSGNGWSLRQLPSGWQLLRTAVFVVSGLVLYHSFSSAASVATEIRDEETASREKPHYSPIVSEHGPIQIEPTQLYPFARTKLYGTATLITFLAITASCLSWLKTPRTVAIVKEEGFTTLIPFVVNSVQGIPLNAGIPSDYNQHDPLESTYTDLGGIAQIQLLPQRNPTPPATVYPTVTDDEAVAFIGHVLQCYFLRSIDEMQQNPPITYTSFETGKGISTTADNPVLVPDAQLYARDRLNELWNATKIQFTGVGGPYDWIWRHYPLKVPRDTRIAFIDSGKSGYAVRFERKPDFRLYFDITLTSMDKGIGTFPRGFEVSPPGWPQPEQFASASTYVFFVQMNFRWTGNRQAGEAYEEWAQGLFSGLQKKLVLPPQN